MTSTVDAPATTSTSPARAPAWRGCRTAFPPARPHACCAARGNSVPQPRQTSARAGLVEEGAGASTVDVMRGSFSSFPGAGVTAVPGRN